MAALHSAVGATIFDGFIGFGEFDTCCDIRFVCLKGGDFHGFDGGFGGFIECGRFDLGVGGFGFLIHRVSILRGFLTRIVSG